MPKTRPVVPTFAFLIVLGFALLMVVGIVIKPWDIVSGSRVSVVASGVPENYSRSELSFVGDVNTVGWHYNPMAGMNMPESNGQQYFIFYGCASCHGVDGRGTSYAPMRIAQASQVLAMVRIGPSGMPVYPKEYLPDDMVAQIAEWLMSQQPPPPNPTPTPAPVTTTPTPTPAPTGTPTGTPGVTPTATPTPLPTTTPIPSTPVPAKGDADHGAKLYTSLGCAACHGAGGKGSAFAPALNTPAFASKFAADSDIVTIMRNGKGMMPAFDSGRLTNGDMADLIAFMRSLQ
ncbi:MAG: c-type cytochrome [Dehalococcoidia bacterium]|nr:c-type cytochrome [Dehalococcoidia bacterium]